MKVTRDVILDLWPVYEAGEASADTRALVEQYLHEDPEFARLVRENGGSKALRPTPLSLPRDSEMDTLLRTQQLLSYRRSALLLGLTLVATSAYLRLYRIFMLTVALLSLLVWVGLMLFGRRWFRLPRR
jgi:hypothetical protein